MRTKRVPRFHPRSSRLHLSSSRRKRLMLPAVSRMPPAHPLPSRMSFHRYTRSASDLRHAASKSICNKQAVSAETHVEQTSSGDAANRQTGRQKFTAHRVFGDPAQEDQTSPAVRHVDLRVPSLRNDQLEELVLVGLGQHSWAPTCSGILPSPIWMCLASTASTARMCGR